MRSKDEDFVNRVVENVLADPDLNPGNVVDKISDVSGVPKNAILSRNRSKVLVEVRHAGFYVCRQLNMSFPEIGALFDRDHTSVMSGVRKIRRHLETPAPVYSATYVNHVSDVVTPIGFLRMSAREALDELIHDYDIARYECIDISGDSGLSLASIPLVMGICGTVDMLMRHELFRQCRHDPYGPVELAGIAADVRRQIIPGEEELYRDILHALDR